LLLAVNCRHSLTPPSASRANEKASTKQDVVMACSAAGLLVLQEPAFRLVCHTSFYSTGEQYSADIPSCQVAKYGALRTIS
jgi:hypothetical protein